jgi:hypothetical protein
MAEQDYVVVYAATYPTVAAARAALDTIEHLHKEAAEELLAGKAGLIVVGAATIGQITSELQEAFKG